MVGISNCLNGVWNFLLTKMKFNVQLFSFIGCLIGACQAAVFIERLASLPITLANASRRTTGIRL
ncbi:hypothetical protein Avbf_18922 [Armadillidium vulgare]|nr:hypothetical protein Avbf_18922 [Armadillidium vulgare]